MRLLQGWCPVHQDCMHGSPKSGSITDGTTRVYVIYGVAPYSTTSEAVYSGLCCVSAV